MAHISDSSLRHRSSPLRKSSPLRTTALPFSDLSSDDDLQHRVRPTDSPQRVHFSSRNGSVVDTESSRSSRAALTLPLVVRALSEYSCKIKVRHARRAAFLDWARWSITTRRKATLADAAAARREAAWARASAAASTATLAKREKAVAAREMAAAAMETANSRMRSMADEQAAKERSCAEAVAAAARSRADEAASVARAQADEGAAQRRAAAEAAAEEEREAARRRFEEERQEAEAALEASAAQAAAAATSEAMELIAARIAVVSQREVKAEGREAKLRERECRRMV